VLADAILALHVAIAAFIVLGLPVIWIGAAFGWRWVRNPWFRYAHLGAIGFVAAEALVGVTCPLTVLEDALRGIHEPRSFVGRWLAWILFYHAPEWIFTTVYVAYAAITGLTLALVPPRART
jgi:hypothetical protein